MSRDIKLNLYDADGTLTELPGRELIQSDIYRDAVRHDEMSQSFAQEREANSKKLVKCQSEIANDDKKIEEAQKIIDALLPMDPVDRSTVAGYCNEIAQLTPSGECIGDDEEIKQVEAKIGWLKGKLSIYKLDDIEKIISQYRTISASEYNNNENKEIASNLSKNLDPKNENKEAEFSYMKSHAYQPQRVGEIKKFMDDYESQHGEKHPSFKLAPGAFEKLKQDLSDPNTKACVVSRNCEEYLRALLLHNGLTENDLTNIEIYDARKLPNGSKGQAVHQIVTNIKKAGDTIVEVRGYDDVAVDLASMLKGVASLGTEFTNNTDKCLFVSKEPGKFFEHMLQPKPQIESKAQGTGGIFDGLAQGSPGSSVGRETMLRDSVSQAADNMGKNDVEKNEGNEAKKATLPEIALEAKVAQPLESEATSSSLPTKKY
jgi:hypothetical protein